MWQCFATGHAPGLPHLLLVHTVLSGLMLCPDRLAWAGAEPAVVFGLILFYNFFTQVADRTQRCATASS